MSQRDDILALAGEARPVIERWLEIGEQIAAFRDLATEKQIEWSQLKAVLVASIKDVDGGKRLQKLAGAADNRLSYADILLNPKGANRKEIKYPDRSAPTKQSPSAVPIPDTTPRDGGAAAPAATDPRSTGIDGPVLSPPSPGTGPTNSDDPYNCIPPQFDRTRELRA